ncbi:MAG: divergent polysaccharide deacetylase family protein [Amphiplicatus sp.]
MPARLKEANRRPRRRRSGDAGAIASFVMAAMGVIIGASFSYLGGDGARSDAAYYEGRAAPGEGPAAGPRGFSGRARLVERLTTGETLERFAPPVIVEGGPRIIVIFDDMGIEKAAFDEIMRMPGPVTFSFLPYAENIQKEVDRARKRGDAVLLHLPMEPAGEADPGPHSLKVGVSATALLSDLDWNLSRFTGYIGVNNHMGSLMTRDEASMKTVLSILDERGLFFLDSLTTSKSVAAAAGRAIGATVYARDVFLDPDLDSETVARQLALVESIARETGFAVAICHPRRATLDVIGPWLTSAPARGFKLDTVAVLPVLEAAWRARDRVAMQ